MENKTVLVTGANGFVGKHIVNALIHENIQIIATYHRSKPISNTKLNWIQADINDPIIFEQQIPKVDYIIHAAGLVSYDPKFEKELYKVNQYGTANLINFALEKNAEKFIYLSSASTLRRSSDESVINEHVPGSPIFYSNYARSKFLGEMEVRRGEAEGLEVAILNPSLILGLGDWNKGSCSIFSKASKGMNFYPSGNVGLVMLEDVVNVCIQILQEKIQTNQNILLNAETWSYQYLFEVLSKGFGVKSPNIKVGIFLSKMASIVDGIISKINSQERLISSETIAQINQKVTYEKSTILESLQYPLKPILNNIQDLCKEYKLKYQI